MTYTKSPNSASSFRCFAILPAAGRSRRMGRPKLLLPWHGKTVIHRVLHAWRESRVTEVIVVVHPEDDELARAVRENGVTAVVPDEPPPDMKASVLAGLALVRATFSPAARDAWLLAPADMPLLERDTINQVVAEHDPRQPRIVIPTHGGRRGHPVLFPWPLAVEAENLVDDEGINHLVRGRRPYEFECRQASILADIDTPEDYRRQHGQVNPSN